VCEERERQRARAPKRERDKARERESNRETSKFLPQKRRQTMNTDVDTGRGVGCRAHAWAASRILPAALSMFCCLSAPQASCKQATFRVVCCMANGMRPCGWILGNGIGTMGGLPVENAREPSSTAADVALKTEKAALALAGWQRESEKSAAGRM